MDRYSRDDAAADLNLEITERPPARLLRARRRSDASRPLAALGVLSVLIVGVASWTSGGASGLVVHQARLPGMGPVAEAAPPILARPSTEEARAPAPRATPSPDPQPAILAAAPRLPIPTFAPDPAPARGSATHPPRRRRARLAEPEPASFSLPALEPEPREPDSPSLEP